MKPARWLDRDLLVGPYLCLCLSEAAFKATMDHMEVPEGKRPRRWVTSDACVHIFDSGALEKVDSMCCVVCIDGAEAKGRDPVAVAGLLVHEAVHVFQNWSESIGEHQPSSEMEAYSIQAISQRLMWSFKEQTKC